MFFGPMFVPVNILSQLSFKVKLAHLFWDGRLFHKHSQNNDNDSQCSVGFFFHKGSLHVCFSTSVSIRSYLR